MITGRQAFNSIEGNCCPADEMRLVGSALSFEETARLRQDRLKEAPSRR